MTESENEQNKARNQGSSSMPEDMYIPGASGFYSDMKSEMVEGKYKEKKDFSIELDGDCVEQKGWLLFGRQYFVNYEKYWIKFVVPNTNRGYLNRNDFRYINPKPDYDEEVQEIAQLSYAIYSHLTRIYEIKNAVSEKSVFEEAYIRLGSVGEGKKSVPGLVLCIACRIRGLDAWRVGKTRGLADRDKKEDAKAGSGQGIIIVVEHHFIERTMVVGISWLLPARVCCSSRDMYYYNILAFDISVKSCIIKQNGGTI